MHAKSKLHTNEGKDAKGRYRSRHSLGPRSLDLCFVRPLNVAPLLPETALKFCLLRFYLLGRHSEMLSASSRHRRAATITHERKSTTYCRQRLKKSRIFCEPREVRKRLLERARP